MVTIIQLLAKTPRYSQKPENLHGRYFNNRNDLLKPDYNQLVKWQQLKSDGLDQL